MLASAVFLTLNPKAVRPKRQKPLLEHYCVADIE